MTRLHLKYNSSKYQNNFKYLIIFSQITSLFILCYKCLQTMVHIQRSENLKELARSFYYVGSGNGTQDVRLDSKCLYLLNHYIIPNLSYLNDTFEYSLF